MTLVVESNDTPHRLKTDNLIGHIICEVVEREMFDAEQTIEEARKKCLFMMVLSR
jgi:hypothetical protein